ncbi:ABC transporter substrate-binding protein, partial [Corynebacterium variabile]|uniref:ABC transporter substrate-binding protein n=1 Tax=Corynebacterium variabile TaxID=1727 RepID=UPI003F904FC4
MKLYTSAPTRGRRWRTRSVLAISTATMLALAACGGSDDDGPEASDSGSVAASDINDKDRDEIQDGGDATLWLEELSEQQNPFQADGNLYTNYVWDFYNPQMVLFDAEGNFQANPDYLTDVSEETADGKTVVTYTINDKAQYNDGTPLDWTAFENTWKANKGDAEGYNISSSDGYVLIDSVTKGDNDKKAVVTFKQEYPWWEGLFNYVLPPQVKDADSFNTAYLKKLNPEWGAGPYKVDRADFNTGEVSFVKNEKWWGDEGKLDKFTYR